jgi:hypothetical protein
MTATPRFRPPRGTLALAAALVAVAAQSQEFQPYPQPRITPEEYAAYADQVRQAFGFTADVVREDNIIVFSDERTRTFWVFTTKDNPAHPAWITRQLVEEDGQVRVRQVGYYAGSEAAFARLFSAFQERNAKLLEDVTRRNQ